MRLFKFILMIILTLYVSGCTQVNPKPETVIVYKTKKVYIPTGCTVPEVDCDFKGDGFIPTVKLLECVAKQKRVLESLKTNKIK